MKFLLQTLCAVLLAVPLVAQHGQSGRADQAQGVGYSPNHGQFPEHVLAFTPFAGGYLFAENDGLTFSLYSRPAHGKDAEQVEHHVYKQAFIGAQSEELQVVDEQLEGWTRNFFLGNDPLTHRSAAPLLSGVTSALLCPPRIGVPSAAILSVSNATSWSTFPSIRRWVSSTSRTRRARALPSAAAQPPPPALDDLKVSMWSAFSRSPSSESTKLSVGSILAWMLA